MNSSSEDNTGLSVCSYSYESCIKIDGRSILPPLMTNARRLEMQKFKELALLVESRLKEKKAKTKVSAQSTIVSLNQKTESVTDGQITTIPTIKDKNVPVPPEIQMDVESNYEVPVVAVSDDNAYDQHFVIKKTYDTIGNFGNDMVPLIQAKSGESSDSDEEMFESAYSTDTSKSSTATFIIRKDDDKENSSQQLSDHDIRSEGEVLSSDEEDFQQMDSPDDADSNLLCTRKRPAFYFDEQDDDEEFESEASTVSTNYDINNSKLSTCTSENMSISLNPFAATADADDEWESFTAKASLGTNPFLSSDNLWIPKALSEPVTREPALVDLSSDSFAPGTPENENSVNIRTPATVQQVQPDGTRKFVSSPRRSRRSASYDVILSTKIPSSAENTPEKCNVSQSNQNNTTPESPDSDKENKDTSRSSNSSSTTTKKHVRKLSYTLDKPSEALIAAGVYATDDDESDGGSLSTIPSSNVTPMKNSDFDQFSSNADEIAASVAKELDSKLEVLDRRLEKLQVGLPKLQSKMKALSPKYLKMSDDLRSPLMRGVAFPSPLTRSHAPVRVPAKALDPSMKQKYDRVTAYVRGYLTRRLLHTDKIQTIIQTIRDTVDFVLKLYEENPKNPAHLQVKPEDVNLHRMLIQQLNSACSSFHGIFFNLSTAERMAIIATDREKLKARALRDQRNTNTNSGKSKMKGVMSAATYKAIERRLSFKPSSSSSLFKEPFACSSSGRPIGKSRVKRTSTSTSQASSFRGSISGLNSSVKRDQQLSSASSSSAIASRNLVSKSVTSSSTSSTTRIKRTTISGVNTRKSSVERRLTFGVGAGAGRTQASQPKQRRWK